jgi:CheY-like chemotaxis protein
MLIVLRWKYRIAISWRFPELAAACLGIQEYPMPRPTLLIAEPEPVHALSTRKLVVETAKFNVLTAHSTKEALELLRIFPKVDLAVLVESREIDCENIAKRLKDKTVKVPIIYLHAAIGAVCSGADHALPSGEPEELVMLLRSLLGDPREIRPNGAS